jgi:hypothetical protein
LFQQEIYESTELEELQGGKEKLEFVIMIEVDSDASITNDDKTTKDNDDDDYDDDGKYIYKQSNNTTHYFSMILHTTTLLVLLQWNIIKHHKLVYLVILS